MYSLGCPIDPPFCSTWDFISDATSRHFIRRRSLSSEDQQQRRLQYSFASGILLCLLLQLFHMSMGIDLPSGPAAFIGTALTAALQTVPDADVKIINRITVGHVRMMVAPLYLGRTCHVKTAVK